MTLELSNFLLFLFSHTILSHNQSVDSIVLKTRLPHSLYYTIFKNS